jgi:hypothetical protein
MRTQQRPSAAQPRERAEDHIRREDHKREDHNGSDDPFLPTPVSQRRNASGTPSPVPMPQDTHPEGAVLADAMQDSPLIASGHAPELDGQEELGPQLCWVSLDAPRVLLVCKNLGMEVKEFVGTIVESRVVRVMGDEDEKDKDEKGKDGGVFCASSNRQTADVGRPGRECGSCEDREGCCFPRWWIAWREEESGQTFAHTLSQTGTMNFTRYAAKLKRGGHVPSEVVTRIFVEEARRQKAGTVYRWLQFEQDDPFRDQ